jgi:hypothetical protein
VSGEISEKTQVNRATLFPEFTDNRPLEATISVHPNKVAEIGHFKPGETVFLSATLRNTSDEVLALWLMPFREYSWIIEGDKGKRVPFRLFRDRNGEPLDDSHLFRTQLLFPGESQTSLVNISAFFALDTPGMYHAVARTIIRRLEVLGEEQIASPQFTFIIDPQ